MPAELIEQLIVYVIGHASVKTWGRGSARGVDQARGVFEDDGVIAVDRREDLSLRPEPPGVGSVEVALDACTLLNARKGAHEDVMRDPVFSLGRWAAVDRVDAGGLEERHAALGHRDVEGEGRPRPQPVRPDLEDQAARCPSSDASGASRSAPPPRARAARCAAASDRNGDQAASAAPSTAVASGASRRMGGQASLSPLR